MRDGIAFNSIDRLFNSDGESASGSCGDFDATFSLSQDFEQPKYPRYPHFQPIRNGQKCATLLFSDSQYELVYSPRALQLR
jgi:hypothetical protein